MGLGRLKQLHLSGSVLGSQLAKYQETISWVLKQISALLKLVSTKTGLKNHKSEREKGRGSEGGKETLQVLDNLQCGFSAVACIHVGVDCNGPFWTSPFRFFFPSP